MPNTNTGTLEDVRKGKKSASKSRSRDRANRGGDSSKPEKKTPSLQVIKLKPAQHQEKRHNTAAERHRAQAGKAPPPEAFAGYAESRELSQGETQAANRGKAAFNDAAAQEIREQTPFQEPAAHAEEDRSEAEERKQKIKRLAANALQAVSGRGSAAAASVRNTVNKARESRPVKAVRNNPARAGLIAAGITGLVAAGVFGTRTVRQKRAKAAPAKGTKKGRTGKVHAKKAGTKRTAAKKSSR